MKTSYSRSAILLHWLLAALLAFQIGMGWLMEAMPAGAGLFNLVQFHKSVGILILLLSIARVGIRLAHTQPMSLPDAPEASLLAKAVHLGLYVVMLAGPLTGWALVSTSSTNIETILFNRLPWPHIPGLASAPAGIRVPVHQTAEWLHGALVWLGIGLFGLHVAGALRHQYGKAEPLLARMLPIAAARQRTAGSLLIVALALSAAVLLQMGENFRFAPAARLRAVAMREPASAVIPRSEAAPQASALNAPVPAAAASMAPVEALPAAAVAAGRSPVGAPVWTVGEDRSLAFSVRWGNDSIDGRFARWDADIRFDPAALAASSIRIEIDLASASTADADRDTMLQGGDFFASSAAPRAIYTASDFRRIAGNRYAAKGTLQLKGVSQSQDIGFTLNITGSRAAVAGTAVVPRKAHGVGTDEYDEIANAVDVRFRFVATRQPGE